MKINDEFLKDFCMSLAYPNHQQLSVLCLASEMIFRKDKSNSKDCESDS